VKRLLAIYIAGALAAGVLFLYLGSRPAGAQVSEFCEVARKTDAGVVFEPCNDWLGYPEVPVVENTPTTPTPAVEPPAEAPATTVAPEAVEAPTAPETPAPELARTGFGSFLVAWAGITAIGAGLVCLALSALPRRRKP
jgi:hypothetical protein